MRTIPRLLILLLLLPAVTHGQNWLSPRYTFSLTGGRILANMPRLDYTAVPFFGVDGAVAWPTSGAQPWHAAWRYPSMGFRFNYTRIPDGIAGDRFAVTAFVLNPVVRWGGNDRCSLSWVIGGGLSCYTNPYSRSHDPLNESIGSYINCMLELGPVVAMDFPDGSSVGFSAKINHSSNGQLVPPNQGLNYVVGELGYTFPSRGQDARVAVAPSRDTATSYLYLSYAPGFVRPRYSGAEHRFYYCYTAQAGYMRRTGVRCAVGGNLDVMYNFSFKELVEWHHSKGEAYQYPYPFNIGLAATAEPYWGPLSMRFSVGGYLMRVNPPSNPTLPVYERVGAFYHFGHSRRHFAGVAMKIHLARIDYIEWHYGICL